MQQQDQPLNYRKTQVTSKAILTSSKLRQTKRKENAKRLNKLCMTIFPKELIGTWGLKSRLKRNVSTTYLTLLSQRKTSPLLRSKFNRKIRCLSSENTSSSWLTTRPTKWLRVLKLLNSNRNYRSSTLRTWATKGMTRSRKFTTEFNLKRRRN